MQTIFLLNGPNLNLTGQRQPEIYGRVTLSEIVAECTKLAKKLGFHLEAYQSNHEGELIDILHKARETAAGVLLNAGAFTHYSYALRDAVALLDIPCIELHLSNTAAREEFRHHSVLSPVVAGVIAGFGKQSYLLGVRAMDALIEKK